MTPVKLKELTSLIEGSRLYGSGDIDVTSIAYHSREVEYGTLFVAVPGFKTDGHEYIEEAMEKGASALIVEKDGQYSLPYLKVPDSRQALALAGAVFYGFPARELVNIGVTGTNGKTTTTYLIERILEHSGLATGLLGTITNRIGNLILKGERTTAESLDLQRMLFDIKNSGGTHVVMEVSSHALKLSRVHGVSFQVAVFTNASFEHGEFHPSFADYVQTKARLFKEHLHEKGIAILNKDDPYWQEMIAGGERQILTYAMKKRADIQGKITHMDAKGLSLEVRFAGKKENIHPNLTGEFNAYNCLAAVGVGLSLGLNLGIIKQALSGFKGVPGRFERVGEDEELGIIVDYAHSPAGLENLLINARKITQGKLVVIFGCGGERDRRKRPAMGRIASELADTIVITADNPRGEPLNQIIEDIKEGLKENSNFLIIHDRKDAIMKTVKKAQKEDLIVIAGKGHETQQEFTAEKIPFDDRQVALEALKARREGHHGTCDRI